MTILDVNLRRLNYLEEVFGSRLKTRFSDGEAIEELIEDADLVIGAVLIAGAKAPKLVTREHLSIMNDGSVVVDVAVDQGGASKHVDPPPSRADLCRRWCGSLLCREYAGGCR